MHEDIEELRAGKVLPTRGDIRCLIFGHLVRLTVWRLRHAWNRDIPIEERLAIVARHLQNHGGLEAVKRYLGDDLLHAPRLQHSILLEDEVVYGTSDGAIAF